MADYCSQADIEYEAGGEKRLIELTDDTNAAVLDATVLAAALATATAWIDSYASARYATGFTTVPTLIRRYTAAETVYLLKARRSMLEDADKSAHAERLSWLEALAKGLVNPGCDPLPATNPTDVARPANLTRDDDEDISRESLEGFW
jgi:phage gp36-like protein